jgi:hypothetical protein
VIDQEAAVIGEVIEAQRRIVDEFELVDGWIERYETLIDFGRASRRCRRDSERSATAFAPARATRGSPESTTAGASTSAPRAKRTCSPDCSRSSSKSIPGAAEDVLHHPLVVLETTGLSRRLSPHRLAAYREILARLRELAS